MFIDNNIGVRVGEPHTRNLCVSQYVQGRTYEQCSAGVMSDIERNGARHE